MITLTISAKGLDKNVKYFSPVQKLNVGELENKLLFTSKNLFEEVMQGSKKQRKKNVQKLKKIYRGFVLLLVGGLSTSPKLAAAATSPPAISVDTSPITPQVVMEWGLTISLIAVAVGVALSGSLLALAGIFRMLKKREEATEWTTDIVKGLVQVLISIPTVYVLFYLAQLVFKGFPILEKLL